jgi:hypothetical protein
MCVDTSNHNVLKSVISVDISNHSVDIVNYKVLISVITVC